MTWTTMGVLLSMQTSMSVRMVMTTVICMRMQTALTQREVSPAPVTLATLEMESTVQISMSVNWVLHVTPMPTALIQLAVLIASVMLAILEMD